MKDSIIYIATSTTLSSESGNSGKKKRSAYIKKQKDNDVAASLLKLGNECNKIIKE